VSTGHGGLDPAYSYVAELPASQMVHTNANPNAHPAERMTEDCEAKKGKGAMTSTPLLRTAVTTTSCPLHCCNFSVGSKILYLILDILLENYNNLLAVLCSCSQSTNQNSLSTTVNQINHDPIGLHLQSLSKNSFPSMLLCPPCGSLGAVGAHHHSCPRHAMFP